MSTGPQLLMKDIPLREQTAIEFVIELGSRLDLQFEHKPDRSVIVMEVLSEDLGVRDDESIVMMRKKTWDSYVTRYEQLKEDLLDASA
jgi:hypothetical protein